MSEDLAALGRELVDASLYLVLGTVGPDGRPWVSPVYYAHADYREFLWVSKPGATHSRNLETHPDVSIAIFDSSAPIGTGRGFYATATAGEVGVDERAAALEVFTRRSREHGGPDWTTADVVEPARLRLYRAVAAERYVLDEGDRRVPVELQ